METWQGALQTVYATVSNEATGGNMYQPDDNGFEGYPTLATIEENALDESVAKKLWSLAEKATGIVYHV